MEDKASGSLMRDRFQSGFRESGGVITASELYNSVCPRFFKGLSLVESLEVRRIGPPKPGGSACQKPRGGFSISLVKGKGQSGSQESGRNGPHSKVRQLNH